MGSYARTAHKLCAVTTFFSYNFFLHVCTVARRVRIGAQRSLQHSALHEVHAAHSCRWGTRPGCAARGA